VAQLIRDDRVDLLIDVNMHMAHTRLRVFAERPAPVQACWIAYPGTTGLSAMNYRISDRYLDPAGSDENYAERTLRLPDTFWCYDPHSDQPPPVSALPALERGYVTFGCLNNFCKINRGVIELWAQVLGALPGSRLIVLAHAKAGRRWFRGVLSELGIDPARVEFTSFQPRRDYLGTYGHIDIGLDSFPYNGHTTSLDAFWMGVPVVTLAGSTVAGRAGVCLAMNLGLPDLVAQTKEEFVGRALALASDLDGLQTLRRSLRARMEASPLMDAPRFARNFESLLRQAWRDWCSEQARVRRP
jgi:predicted O-linked N-acetylglucosamine transferase (SPINDLY family)